MKDLPLISCLCVTHKKPDMLKRAIRCFDNQTYPNKQMVIVYEESDQPTHEFVVEQKFDTNIKIVKINTNFKMTLGELRNISVSKADGSFVCQWDDDDWYGAYRLSKQMNHLLQHEKSASILSRWIVFDSCSQKAYLSHTRLWEGSILCRRDLMLQNPYPPLPKAEDTCVIDSIHKNGELSIIHDMPSLYVYIIHGNNTWDHDHFKKMLSCSRELSPSNLEKVIQAISN